MKSQDMEQQRSTRVWRYARYALVGLAGGATLIALFYAVENWRGQATWAECKRELEARGERLDWDAYIPKPVPDEQNFARTPLLEAIGYKDTLDRGIWSRFEAFQPAGFAQAIGDWSKGRPTDLDAVQRRIRDTPGFNLPPGERSAAADVMEVLRQLEPEWNELRAASQQPFAQFSYDPGRPWDPRMPNYVALRTLAQMLSVRASAELAANDPEGAFADIRVIHKIAESLEGQPYLVTTMMRLAILSGAGLQPVWEGVSARRWSDKQLAEFQERFARLDFLEDYRRAMRGGERAVINYLIEMRPDELDRLVYGDQRKRSTLKDRLRQVKSRLAPSGWRKQNQTSYNRVIQDFAIAPFQGKRDQISPSAVRALETQFVEERDRKSPYNRLCAAAVPNVFRAMRTATRNQVAMDQALIACALERYRGANGTYPETLAALSPQFLVRVPVDRIGGQPLKYQRTADASFRLYSVGWDQIDDNGEPGGTGEEGDWVWNSARPIDE